MEKPTKVMVWNLLAISFAGCLVLAALFVLIRPQYSGAESFAEEFPVLQGNWFTPRTFALLGSEPVRVAGIDAAHNPFISKAALQAAEQRAEPVVLDQVPEPVAPPPPATRQVSLVYRGFYRSSSGKPFVYVELKNATSVYPVGQELVPNWTIVEAKSKELILEQGGGKRVGLPFNRKKSLEVPIE